MAFLRSTRKNRGSPLGTRVKRLPHYKLLLLVTLVCAGIILQLSGKTDLIGFVGLARQYAGHWWLALLLILIQIVLFTFAMTGSSMVWITAALFTPASSCLIMTTGTTLGGVSAYFFSSNLSGEWARKVATSRVYTVLQQEGGFASLLALRVMPGFPHSIINYSSGILRLKLTDFVAATVAGTALKTYLYSVLIYNATTPEDVSGGVGVATVWPLLLLSLLLLVFALVKRSLNKRKDTD